MRDIEAHYTPNPLPTMTMHCMFVLLGRCLPKVWLPLDKRRRDADGWPDGDEEVCTPCKLHDLMPRAPAMRNAPACVRMVRVVTQGVGKLGSRKGHCCDDAVVVQDHSAEHRWVPPSLPAGAARIVQQVQCLCPYSTLPFTIRSLPTHDWHSVADRSEGWQLWRFRGLRGLRLGS